MIYEHGALHDPARHGAARARSTSVRSTASSPAGLELGNDLLQRSRRLQTRPTDTVPEAMQPGAVDASSLTARETPETGRHQ